MTYLVLFTAAAVLVGLLLRSRARKQAEERGVALLRSWLTPEQDRQWAVRRYFEVVGCDSGTRYRITRGTVYRKVAEWCFAPEGKLVMGDVLLAQKIALETVERKALTIANRCGGSAPTSRSWACEARRALVALPWRINRLGRRQAARSALEHEGLLMGRVVEHGRQPHRTVAHGAE
jgi:hypothetical protein